MSQSQSSYEEILYKNNGLVQADNDELEPVEWNPTDFIEFDEPTRLQLNHRFKVTATSYPFRFRNQDQIPDAERVARAAFQHILDQAAQEAGDSDLLGGTINHPALDHEIMVPYLPKNEFSIDKLMQTVESVQQSKKELNFDDTMEMEVIRVTPPEGRGFKNLHKLAFDEFYSGHAGGHGSAILEIKNKDWLCLARAVEVAKAHYKQHILGDKSAQYKSVARDSSRHTLQKDRARALMVRAGLVGLQKQSCGIPEIKKVQKILQKEGFQLKVFQYEEKNTVIFDEQIPDLPYLYLYYHHNHFDVVTSPKIFVGRTFFCDLCNKGYELLEEHKCSVICPCCKSPGRCKEDFNIICQRCNRRFKSNQCFDNHLKRPETFKATGANKRKRGGEKGNSICMKLKKCLDCGRCVSKSKLPLARHHCGQTYCPICKVYYKTGEFHLCFMQLLRTKNKNDYKDDLLPGEGEDDPDDITSLIREVEERQGETEASRKAHFELSGASTKDNVSRYLFWDFETTLRPMRREKETTEGNRSTTESQPIEKNITVDKKTYSLGPVDEHVPNYCVVRKARMLCKEFWLGKCEGSDCKARNYQQCQRSKPECKVCGENKVIFSGEDTNDKFCRYLFRKEHRGITAIAHNAKGFDAQFIIQWLAENEQHITPKITPRGTSILSLEALGVRIIDSHAFLPQSLASLPKTFNEPELKKGYFPYLFNKPENQNYVGPYPEADQYCPSQMKPEARKTFYKWYNQQKHGIFDMQQEIRQYTESDVDILLRCCLKFNDLFHQQTGVYPLENAITIAQACNQVFRKCHLQPNIIGVIPYGGYRGKERQSLVALEWLRWMSHQTNTRVGHARNGREKKIGPYKADGYIHELNTVLEFNGCVWHGCLKCYKTRDKKVPNSSLTYEEAYQKTCDRAEFIKSQGYFLQEIWECEWQEEKKENPAIDEFLKQFDPFQALSGRDALYGGRTNATVLWRKCKNGEKIYYYDVCSLYPWVCKYGKFPIGHPRVITENFESITGNSKPYFGLVRCKVLPPRSLLHPVLPYKHGGRLNFPLCRTCLENEAQQSCLHSDDERSFIGSFVSLELNKAVDLGYKVTEIYEVWHYEQVMKYDKQNEDTGLFATYINQFLKLKQEKSGWPAWVKTEEDKARYIEDYENRERIQLNPAEIEKNSGLRAIAKLMLNSFWGKFAQKDDMSATDFYTDPNEFFDAVLNNETKIKAIRILSDDMVAVTSKKNPLHQSPNPNTSVVLAAFVTAQARLKLYSYLEKLQDRILYFDTDSIIFVTRPGDQYMPPTGDYLGDLTNELEDYGPGCYICEFVSCGPKQYSFIVVDQSGSRVGVVTKVKGFSLNYTNSAHTNFQRMKRQVWEYVQCGNYERDHLSTPNSENGNTQSGLRNFTKRTKTCIL